MAPRLLLATLAWTLALLLLGSVVHATESSLACPDWPTCFGTMTPEMTGGVFWEHLHRLWAGALVLMFGAAVVAIKRTASFPAGLYKAGLLGLALLLVQSVLGGITVIYRLPDAVSTSHLSLAFLFLALVTVMATVTSKSWSQGGNDDAGARRDQWKAGLTVAVLVYLQSVVGGLVRHKDAGVACPDVPLCLGRIVPPLDHPLVQLHFAHRALGVTVGVVSVLFALRVLRDSRSRAPRALAYGITLLVIAQILLGFISVATQLHPAAVSSHTLLAASLLALATALATYGRRVPGETVGWASG